MFIPMEREIDDLIAGCNQHIATFLRIGKETEQGQEKSSGSDGQTSTSKTRLYESHQKKTAILASSKSATRFTRCVRNYPKTKHHSATTPTSHTCAAVSNATANEAHRSSATQDCDKYIPHATPLESHNGIPQNQRHTLRNATPSHRNIKNTLIYT
jgi:hypothetical protein